MFYTFVKEIFEIKEERGTVLQAFLVAAWIKYVDTFMLVIVSQTSPKGE